MPLPGQVNNGLGINAFSGPMGEKEPAYGAGERLKVQTALAPVGTPAALGAPKRAKRAAVKGKRAAQATTDAAPALPPDSPLAAAPAAPTYGMQMTAFWQQLAADPEASPLVRQYAAAAHG